MKKSDRRSKPRSSHFVPRAVYRTAFAGVIPLCVAGTACGGSVSEPGTSRTDAGDSGDDGTSPVVITGGVGCAAFMCGSVANIGFDAGEDSPAPLGVAYVGFDAGVADAAFGPDANAATQDASVDAPMDAPVDGVACIGFCGVVDAGFGVADAGFGSG